MQAARADHRQAGRRSARPRPASTACSRSTSTPGRSRASSTSRSTTCSPAAGHRRLPRQEGPARIRWSCRPTPAAWSARAPSPSACTRAWRSSTSGASGPNVADGHAPDRRREGKDAIVIDDMIDTAGTLVQAVSALEREGARRILACGVHAVLSGPGDRAHQGRAAGGDRRHELDPRLARQAAWPRVTVLTRGSAAGRGDPPDSRRGIRLDSVRVKERFSCRCRN